MLTLSQRERILAEEIEAYCAQGMEVVQRAETTAHLRRRTRMSRRMWVIGILTLGLGFMAYMRWNMRRPREENLLIEVTVDGEVVADRF